MARVGISGVRAGKNVRPAAVFLLERGVLGAQLLVLRAQTLLLRLVRRQGLGGLRLGLGHGHGARGRAKDPAGRDGRQGRFCSVTVSVTLESSRAL